MTVKKLAPLLMLPPLLAITLWLWAATSFDPNAQPVGYVSQPGITNFDIKSGSEIAFRPDYDRNNWSGNLLAVPISADGVAENGNAEWEGAVEIDSQNYDTGRKIFTRSGSSGVAFRWASLSTAQKDSISASATTGATILNYVRGDRSNEKPSGANFYARNRVMGAVIHSTPRLFSDGTDDVVYVGANDGMLHAFDADTGTELWGYVPSAVIGNLNKLTVDPYVLQHFVDGNQVIGRVTISGAQKTVLVGGLGAGGKSLYALDITDQTPASEAAAAAMSLWEITNASTGFANLGYSYGSPRMVKVNTGADAVIVNNGYVNSGNGKAALFVINAATGALIKEIATTGADAGTVSSPNGLSSVRLVDSNGDGTVDYGYAGDLDGNLWKFDLSSSSSGAWTASLLYTTSPAQAITTAPSVRFHPSGGYMVLFATGRMLSSSDSTSTATHYAYGIWDGAPVSNTTFVSQTLTEKTYVNGASTLRVRVATNTAPNWASGGHRGWKTALPIAGERVVGDGTFIDGERFSFTSTNPTVINTVKPDGENWLNELDYLSGGAPRSAIFNLNGDGIVDSLDLLKDSSGVTILTNLGRPVSKFLRGGLASQPILVREAQLDDTLFTFNSDGVLVADDPGVSGGHFDLDIFYGTGDHNLTYDNTGGNLEGFVGTDHVPDARWHAHQYDDRFGVTGVDFLNPSSTNFKLSKAITSTSTQFKVLVYNQYYSPAATISVGGAGYVPVRNYGGLTGSSLNLSSLPTYTRANITSLSVQLPLDTFIAKDWASDGDTRAGLLPTSWDCVVDDDRGILGTLHNGALTVQLIKSSTPGSAVVLNVAGRPDLGYRVKDSSRSSYILAEYSIYWHMPNSGFKVNGVSTLCSHQSGWNDSPPQETGSTADPQTPAAGSTDPKGGDFTLGSAIVTDITNVVGATTTRTTTYSDGVERVIVMVDNGDGTITTTTTVRDAMGTILSSETIVVPTPGSTIGEGGEQVSSPYGRLSWREL